MEQAYSEHLAQIISDINPYHFPCFMKVAFENHATSILRSCDNIPQQKNHSKSITYKIKISWLEDFYEKIFINDQKSTPTVSSTVFKTTINIV